MAAASLLIIIIAAPAASARPATQTRYHVNEAYHNGSRGLLSFQQNGGQTSGGITAIVELPRGYANAFCARAELRVNERTVADGARDCDTNGDALLFWRFADRALASGDVVSLWFSDAVTRYAFVHPFAITD
jgi:hypothetical protein